VLNVNPIEKEYEIILDNEKKIRKVSESDITFPFKKNHKVFARDNSDNWEFGLVENFNKNDRNMKIHFKPYNDAGKMTTIDKHSIQDVIMNFVIFSSEKTGSDLKTENIENAYTYKNGAFDEISKLFPPQDRFTSKYLFGDPEGGLY